MADEQTPTTEDVRLVYGPDSTGMLQDGTVAAFDRHLADHDREVAEKAWDEGYAYATIRDGVLVEVPADRDETLPLLDYYGGWEEAPDGR